MTKLKKYLLWFAQEHIDFRYAEIKSIIQLFNLNLEFCDLEINKPYWIVELPNEEEAKKLASRSVSMRCILELWSYGKRDEMHSNLKKYIKEHKETEQYFCEKLSFKINVETYNKHFTQKEKVQKIENFDYLPLRGKVNLKAPDVEWWYIEFYGMNPKDVPNDPFSTIFARWVADGQRNLINELSLKNRKFIGNTSMDAQLSLLMANQALVKPSDLVFDPFVGTGSLLVSAAKFGAYVMGTDIDYMMLHAKSRPSRISQKIRDSDESIKANLKQYDCEKRFIDVFVSDFSNPVWRDNIEFDSIITDPPYGIREATSKIDTKISEKINSRDPNAPHYPSTSPYSLHNLYRDLLRFSAKHLKMNCRLVCWLPFHQDDYSNEAIPQHPCLKLVANSEQRLCGQTSRRLLTYTKVRNIDDYDTTFEQSSEFHDFRERYFYNGQSRKERKIERAKLREIGKIEAIKHGKTLDENGKVISNKKKSN
ncbi:tRNA (guanine(10)-N2)-methyltransferase homolog isoform X2 [Condylostylus longicornis]|uniref:tRNA (guanine(10)-N2)-methyltransferase homolog isoform X2 n=1 Tax=Condylostylus longicornis TaxID=2530218 RepID=UPI00244DF94C|nr:tRNA (guanine(10)-N2)-methyltransferase homolog isoform X2 [Condylostylus longicornis]